MLVVCLSETQHLTFIKLPFEKERLKQIAEIAMRVDDNLVGGLDDGVAVPEFVVLFLNTAMQEVMLNN